MMLSWLLMLAPLICSQIAAADSEAVSSAIQKARNAEVMVRLSDIGLAPEPSATSGSSVGTAASPVQSHEVQTIADLKEYFSQTEARINGVFTLANKDIESWATEPKDTVESKLPLIADTLSSICCGKTRYGTDPGRMRMIKDRFIPRGMSLDPSEGSAAPK